MNVDIIVGYTLPDMVITALLCLAAQGCYKKLKK